MFRRDLFVGLDEEIPQKTEIFTVSAVKGSYPINAGYYFALLLQRYVPEFCSTSGNNV
jgi:hypothetical protein